MDFKNLQAFYELTKLKSFKLVAEHLNSPQSSVSRRIQILEKEYGVTLFRRSTTGVTLTQDGEKFLKITENIIRSIYDLEYEIIGKKKKFVIQSTANTASDLIIHCIKDINIEIPIQIVTDTENAYFDLYIGPRSKVGENTMILDEKDLYFSPHASHEYLRKMGIPKKIDDLNSHNLVVFNPFKSDFSQTNIIESIEKANIVSNVTFTDSGYVELMMIKEGLGIGVIAEPYSSLYPSCLKKLNIKGIPRVRVPMYATVNKENYTHEKKEMSDNIVIRFMKYIDYLQK